MYNNECTKNMKVKVATSQFKALKGDFEANLNKAISLVEKASNENVDILLLSLIHI